MAHDHDHDHSNCDHDHSHDAATATATAPAVAGPALTAVLEDLGPCKKLLKVEVPSSEIKKEIDGRLSKLRKTVHLKGFRKGKAPRQRIEKLYGDAVRDDARDHLLRQSYMKALEEQLGVKKLLGEGTIENVDFSEAGLKFEVTVHTRPEFEVPEYKGLEIKVGTIDVTEEELNKALDNIRRGAGKMEPVEGDGAIVEGEDQLKVDVQVWLADEHETWSQQQEDADADAESNLKPLKEEFGVAVQLPYDRLHVFAVEDLADSLTGLKIGEWGDCETELAPDYEVVEGRNEPAVLRICVQSINRLVLPELTEDWAKEAGFNSIDHLKSETREDLQQRSELMRNRSVEERLLAKLRETVGDFDLPSELLEKEIESAEKRRAFEMRIQQGKSEQEAETLVAEERDTIREEVERMLRNFFLLDEISGREGIEVSDADVQARIMRLAASRGQDPHAVREELEKHNVLGQLRHDLLDEKTRAYLRTHAKITESEDL
jgi:trigger factor